MARKKDLASKLSGKQPGWRDTITSQQPAKQEPPKKEKTFKRKTYLLTPDLIDRIEALADDKRVGINELVRFLIETSIEQIEEGEIIIPTKPGKRRIAQ